MRVAIFIGLLGLWALPARADHESATGAAHEALEAQADAPKAPPTLPDQASDRARYVQQNIAHHKQGAAARAGHANDDASRHAGADDSSDNDSKSEHGAAASAEKSANADSHAAAGQARATEARGGNPPGSGNPHGNPGKGHH